MQIRSAEKNDIQALSALAISTFTDSFGSIYSAQDVSFHLEKTCSPSYFSQAIEKDYILVMEENGQLIGYLKYGAVGLPLKNIADSDIELHRIYVDASYHGKGVGRELMQAFLSKPEAQSAPHIYLGVWEKNTRAQRFYQHYGFEVVGGYDYYVGRHIDREWIMVRRNTTD